MKKLLKKTLILMIATILTFSSITVQAADTHDNWTSQILNDYEPFQKMLREDPNAKMIQNSTEYLLAETIKDKEGNVIETSEKTFATMSSMIAYENQLKQKDMIRIYSIGDGETKYKTYTKMRVGLSLYKYTNGKFFVSFVYDWLTKPGYDIFTYYKAVVGLALDSGLTMDGTSYGGRVSMKFINGTTLMKNNLNGGVFIQAAGTQGIGYKIKESHQTNGEIVNMNGVISCDAYKTSSASSYCSAYGEYADVNVTLDLDDFSVSIPGGISFGFGTNKTPYNYQDALYIN